MDVLEREIIEYVRDGMAWLMVRRNGQLVASVSIDPR